MIQVIMNYDHARIMNTNIRFRLNESFCADGIE